MKKGDLVVYKRSHPPYVGLVVDLTEKKVWRVGQKGKKVDWNKVDPEPHAVVLWEHNEGTIEVPVIEIDIVES